MGQHRFGLRASIAGFGFSMGLATLTLMAAPAFGYGPTPNSSVDPAQLPQTASNGPAPASNSSGLAFTGTDAAITVTLGSGAIAAGGMIVLATRQRRTVSPS